MKPLKILIVDDEQVIRDLITQVLRLKGHAVSQAMSGQEALQKVAEEEFGVIFMDIMMPDMDGVEAFKSILAVKPKSVVVMMTGFAVEEKIREAMKLGAFDFLYKPFNIVELVAILGKLEKGKKLKRVKGNE